MTDPNTRGVREELTREFESGRQHPFALFQHLAKNGEEERARLVAEIGPDHLTGRERLEFHHLVRHTYPDIRDAENAARRGQRESTYEQNTEAIGASLKRMNEEKRQRRLSQPFTPSRGWNTAPSEDEGWRS